MSALALTERAGLLALLSATGPLAPTLCDGWTTHDLAAHLAVRERRPDAAVGIVIPGLARRTERIRAGYRSGDYDRLIRLLAAPPWWSPFAVPAIDRIANAVEFFVHHEDVRRAVPGWQPRPLPRPAGEELWKRAALARLPLRGAGMTVKLVAPGYGQRTIGTGPIGATVTGDPGEVLLLCFGRQRHSRAEVDGPQADRLRTAALGL